MSIGPYQIDVWVMDDEYCCNCGTALDIRFETTLCTDCLHDAWYDEEQDYYDGWGSDWDLPEEEVNKP